MCWNCSNLKALQGTTASSCFWGYGFKAPNSERLPSGDFPTLLFPNLRQNTYTAPVTRSQNVGTLTLLALRRSPSHPPTPRRRRLGGAGARKRAPGPGRRRLQADVGYRRDPKRLGTKTGLLGRSYGVGTWNFTLLCCGGSHVGT